jgi:hypothetical protein
MNMRAYRGVWAILGCGLAAAGCKETVEGKYLDTEGIALVADVTAESAGKASVELAFKSGGDESNTYVDLGDDKVTVTGDGKGKVLNAKARGEYETSFDLSKADAEFSIALDRKDADKKDAKSTSGKLPKDFDVTIDASGDVSRQDELVVQWSPSGENGVVVEVDLDGDCISFTFKSGEKDDGEFVVPAKDLIFGGKDDDEGDCEVQATVTRTRNGDVDDVFDSESKLRLHQVRKATFTSVK